MSTRFDILAAKSAYEDHVSAHHCRSGCADRAAAWDAYMDTARRWGIEPGDDARQRAQFHDLVKAA